MGFRILKYHFIYIHKWHLLFRIGLDTLYFVLVQTCLEPKSPTINWKITCVLSCTIHMTHQVFKHLWSQIFSFLSKLTTWHYFLFTGKNVPSRIYWENVMDIALFLGEKLKSEKNYFWIILLPQNFHNNFKINHSWQAITGG